MTQTMRRITKADNEGAGETEVLIKTLKGGHSHPAIPAIFPPLLCPVPPHSGQSINNSPAHRSPYTVKDVVVIIRTFRTFHRSDAVAMFAGSHVCHSFQDVTSSI